MGAPGGDAPLRVSSEGAKADRGGFPAAMACRIHGRDTCRFGLCRAAAHLRVGLNYAAAIRSPVPQINHLIFRFVLSRAGQARDASFLRLFRPRPGRDIPAASARLVFLCAAVGMDRGNTGASGAVTD